MAFIKGRGIKVEISKTFGAAIPIAAITQASPAVATSAGHGLADGSCGYLTGLSGMVTLEGQAVRVDAPAADTFTLQGLNTANAPAFNAGSFRPVTAWETLAECDQYELGGGSSDKIDVTCLIDVGKQEENGLLATQSATLNLRATDVPSPAMQIIEAAAQAGERVVVRITLPPSGAVRVFAGEPSLPGESVQVGSVGSGSIGVAVKGVVLKLAA